MKISYLPQANINKIKWDRCIDNSGNGLIYAYSFYLDAISQNWDAIVLNDYEMVMPLTWKKKYGIYYLYQPFLTASLGVFGNNISAEIVKSFLENIPAKFKYWDFYLNRENLFSIQEFPMYERNNYILPLKNSYENLKNNYAKSHQRNIKRAVQFGNIVRKNIPIDEVIQLARNQERNFSKNKENDYESFSHLFEFLRKKANAITYGVYSTQNKLVASCAWFFSRERAYYILVGNHPDGKTSGASHLMIDEFIKDHAGEDLLLDFEGSNASGIAFFYKSFGAVLEKYPGIKLNRLSPIAKLFRQ